VTGGGPGGHALLHACGTQSLAEDAAAILAATVAVEDDALGAASGGEGGVEGLDDQIAAQGGRCAGSHNTALMLLEDGLNTRAQLRIGEALPGAGGCAA
jgi:hypothetical protein